MDVICKSSMLWSYRLQIGHSPLDAHVGLLITQLVAQYDILAKSNFNRSLLKLV
jgi:hypothetical protein